MAKIFEPIEIAIDMGTSRTQISYNGLIILDQPSVVMSNFKTGRLFAAGNHAYIFEEDILYGSPYQIIYPLKDGVITDFRAAKFMLNSFLKRIYIKPRSILSPKFKLVFSIPACVTDVEKSVFKKLAKKVSVKKSRFIQTPIAAANGIGLDIFGKVKIFYSSSSGENEDSYEEQIGKMIVDIGYEKTEITVIALGGIVISKSIKCGGKEFDTEIKNYIRNKHNISIEEETAERIKLNIDTALLDIDNPLSNYEVVGQDLLSNNKKTIFITHNEISTALERPISKIEKAIINTLEMTPKELVDDISLNGINLVGGGSLLKGLDKYIQRKLKIPVHLAKDPTNIIIHGMSFMLMEREKFSYLIK